MPRRLAVGNACTFKYEGRVLSLETWVRVSGPGGPTPGPNAEEEISKLPEFKAIWDTGATSTCVSELIVQTLGLAKIDEEPIQTVGGPRLAGVYLVDIYLPNRVIFTATTVVDAEISGGDVLIGMDIIGKGDFAVTHKRETTCMTFQIPSSHEFDFVEELEKEEQKLRAKRALKNSRKKKPRYKR